VWTDPDEAGNKLYNHIRNPLPESTIRVPMVDKDVNDMYIAAGSEALHDLKRKADTDAEYQTLNRRPPRQERRPQSHQARPAPGPHGQGRLPHRHAVAHRDQGRWPLRLQRAGRSPRPHRRGIRRRPHARQRMASGQRREWPLMAASREFEITLTAYPEDGAPKSGQTSA